MNKYQLIPLLSVIAIVMGGIIFVGLNLRGKPESEPKINASVPSSPGLNTTSPETGNAKEVPPSKNLPATEVGGQDPLSGESISAVDFDAFNGRSGSLAEILKELGMSTDLTRAAAFLQVNLQQECRVSVEESSTGRIEIELSDFREFRFRKDLRELVGYMDLRAKDIPPTLTHEDAIDPEDARRVAQEFLTLLGLEYDLSNTPFELTDSHNQHDLFGARWDFRVFQEYRGFRVSGHMLVSVAAYSGDVELLVRTPFIAPDNMEIRIDEKDALASVAHFAESRGLRIGGAAVTDKWITLPTSVWEEDPEKRKGPDRANPRPAYQVFVVDAAKTSDPANHKKAYYYNFFVDCYTGEIIGSGGRESRQKTPALVERFEAKLGSR